MVNEIAKFLCKDWDWVRLNKDVDDFSQMMLFEKYKNYLLND